MLNVKQGSCECQLLKFFGLTWPGNRIQVYPTTRGKRLKNSKTRPKNSTIMPLSGGGQGKKDRKIAKKHRKIALFSLYLLNLYHVWKSREGTAPLPPAADAHGRGSGVVQIKKIRSSRVSGVVRIGYPAAGYKKNFFFAPINKPL